LAFGQSRVNFANAALRALPASGKPGRRNGLPAILDQGNAVGLRTPNDSHHRAAGATGVDRFCGNRQYLDARALVC